MFDEERLREAEVWIASLAPHEVMTMQGNLCKSVLALIDEVRRLNAALEQMTDPAARTGGALQTAHGLFLEAAEAAETYHAAWVDAGEILREGRATAEGAARTAIRNHGRAVRERDDAQNAAETYHAAWVDAAEYWKERVAELEAEIAAPYCSFCGGNHWGNEHR
jgi:hypothetical protein